MLQFVSPLLLDILTLGNKKVNAMALWPVVLYRDAHSLLNPIIANHEKIHHRQQLELFVIPYYIWYFIEYWIAMFNLGFRHFDAYMSISFEREAYDKQADFDYLKTRKWLASWPYFKDKFRRYD